jgi:hypothetical protein
MNYEWEQVTEAEPSTQKMEEEKKKKSLMKILSRV